MGLRAIWPGYRQYAAPKFFQALHRCNLAREVP
jgi:hypothetical protein